MSAQMRIIQQNSTAAILKELKEFVVNPALIEEAHKVLREQISLTEEEKTKAEEARANIRKYEKTVLDAQKKLSKLEDDKEKFQETIATFQAEKKAFDDLCAQKEKLPNEKEENINAQKIDVNDAFEAIEQKKQELLYKEKSLEQEYAGVSNSLAQKEKEIHVREQDLFAKEKELMDKFNKMKSLIGI